MRTIAAVLLCLIPAFSAAQINKCLDSSGKVVGYATDCPAGTRPEQTGISNHAWQRGRGTAYSERDADSRKRQIEQKESAEKSEKKAAEAQQRKDACPTRRRLISRLCKRASASEKRIRPQIKPSFLAHSDYPKEIAAAERAVAANCK